MGSCAVSLGSSPVLRKPPAISIPARKRREVAALKLCTYCEDILKDKIEKKRMAAVDVLKAMARISVGKASRVHICADSHPKQRHAALSVPQKTCKLYSIGWWAETKVMRANSVPCTKKPTTKLPALPMRSTIMIEIATPVKSPMLKSIRIPVGSSCDSGASKEWYSPGPHVSSSTVVEARTPKSAKEKIINWRFSLSSSCDQAVPVAQRPDEFPTWVLWRQSWEGCHGLCRLTA